LRHLCDNFVALNTTFNLFSWGITSAIPSNQFLDWVLPLFFIFRE
jgi:hypothetical protein